MSSIGSPYPLPPEVFTSSGYENPINQKSSLAKFFKNFGWILALVLVISGYGVNHLLQKNRVLSPITDSAKFAVNLFSENPSTCSPAMNSGFMTCIISIQISNNSSIPQHLYGSVYAVADSSVYKADTNFSSTSIDTYNDILDPNETKGSVLAFSVPTGSTITDIFVANNGSTSPADSIFDLKLSVAAVESASTAGSSSSPSLSDNSSDSSDIESRLNSAGTTSWSLDPVVNPATPDVHVYLGDTCAAWVFPDQQSAQSAVDNGTFSSMRSWIGTDSTTNYGIVLAADAPDDQCAQTAVSVFNWNPLQ
jgi:hypothetical protein